MKICSHALWNKAMFGAPAGTRVWKFCPECGMDMAVGMAINPVDFVDITHDERLAQYPARFE